MFVSKALILKIPLHFFTGLTTDMATSVLIVLNAALNGWAVFAMNNRLREKALSLLKSSRKF